MRINLTSVLVDDQDKALRFYTEMLGFEEKTDVPLGEHRWLTVVSPEDPDGIELVLEPDAHPAVRPFKEALVADGIPFTSFAVDDVHAEHERLRALGVRFTQEPTEMGPVTTAVLDDTCGNLIQIAHQAGRPMSAQDELTELEQRLASGDLDAYATLCADDAVFVLPGMVATKEQAIEGLRQMDPWNEFSVADVRVRELGERAVALIYRFRARRGDTDYTADMVSTWVRGDRGWRLVTHQQTPVPEAG